jgi:uncharacterized protein involved in propanediol utilization
MFGDCAAAKCPGKFGENLEGKLKGAPEAVMTPALL